MNLVASALDQRKGGTDDNEAQANHLVTGFHLTQDPIDNGDATPALSKGNQKGCATLGVARSLNAKRGHRLDGDSDTFIGEPQVVRRLTPTECERLQSFPDGWTCMCGCDPYNTFDCKCPDSPRYAALGNAVTVNVAHWIAKRIVAVSEGVII